MVDDLDFVTLKKRKIENQVQPKVLLKFLTGELEG